MMKRSNIIIIAAIIPFVIAVAACSKWDDYKKYNSEGEILYTGKIDSVKAYPGRLRIKLTGLLPEDPKVTRAKITWNDDQDSVSYSIKGASGDDTLFSKIVSVPEGILNFKITTYDAAGNSSMVVTTSGRSYGPKYESGLVNRPVARAELLSSGSAEIEWDSFDTTTAKGTWIWYTKTDDMTDSVFVPVSEPLTTLADFKGGTSVELRTLYLPAPNTIDTFYAASQMVGVSYDITSQYLVNPGINFNCAAGCNDRWQTPTDWITTSDVRNGGNDIGGLDAGGWLPSKALSIEAWWGMTPVPNGKVYQSLTLPAGKYKLVVTTGDGSSGGTKYITIAPGTVLPDVDNVPSEAIVYKTFANFTDMKLEFELTAETQIALGMQGNLPAEGNFMKVFKVRLYGTP